MRWFVALFVSPDEPAAEAGSITDSCSPLKCFLSALHEPCEFKLVVRVASGRDGMEPIKAPGVMLAAC